MMKRRSSGERTRLPLKLIAFSSAFSLMMLSFTGCGLSNKDKEVLAPPLTIPQKIEIKTMDVKKGKLANNVTVKGTFFSTNQIPLSFKSRGGFLKTLNTHITAKVNAGEVIAELNTDSLQNEIKQQEIACKMATLDYENAKKNPNASSFDLERMNFNLQNAQKWLENLNQQLKDSKIVAPITGEVIFVDKVQVGDYINQGRPLIIIADPKPENLLLEYKGEETSVFQPGAKVTIYLNGYNPNDVGNNKEAEKKSVRQGEVVMCPTSLPRDAGTDVKDVIRVRVKDLPASTSIHETADIIFTLEKRDNAIILDKNNIITFNNENYVYVLKDGMKVKRNLELGLQVGNLVEVVKGLNEGEKIVVDNMSS